MVKIRIGTIISVLINLFLTFWLVNQYLNDFYFQNYVNASIGPYSPFIVLTIGLGGGSGFGYILLKRRHGDKGIVDKIQKSKSFKPGSLLSTGSPTASPSRQVLPTGAPPSAGSKHTAYAVPPLPKTPTSSSPKTTPTLSWSAGAKPSTNTFSTPKPETMGKSTSSVLQTLRAEASRPTSSPFQPTPTNQPSPTMRQPAEPSTQQAPAPAWNPSPSSMDDRRPESGPIFQKPGLDTSARQEAAFPSTPAQSPNSISSAVPSKWAPPTDRQVTSPSSESPGIRSIPPLPTKWTPPSGSAPTNPQGSPPPQGIPRPSPMPMRPPVPQTQGGPRPFVIQGPGRPGEQRPMAPPRPFGAVPPRPPPPPPTGMGTQPGSPQSGPRQPSPMAGPMPQPWKPPAMTLEKESTGSFEKGGTPSDLTPRPGSETKNPPESTGGGGEMDWDTALDTILKTLRKDRGVGEAK
jgi:hypothetical protein